MAWVDDTERIKFPLPPECLQSVPLAYYSADSILNMGAMRKLQWAFAEANFANSRLGIFPNDVWQMILDRFGQHEDPVPGVR